MVTPTATIPSSAESSRMFDITGSLRKRGANIAKNTKMTTTAMTTPDSGRAKRRQPIRSRAAAAAVDGCCSPMDIPESATASLRIAAPVARSD